MKIFNIKQASLFLVKGATAINCGLGNKNKTYIEFNKYAKKSPSSLRWGGIVKGLDCCESFPKYIRY